MGAVEVVVGDSSAPSIVGTVSTVVLAELPFAPDAFVMDVSFISPVTVLRHLQEQFPSWQGIVLFKPQFFVEESQLVRGVVKEKAHRDEACQKFSSALAKMNIDIRGQMASPLLGARGNQEFLFWLEWG